MTNSLITVSISTFNRFNNLIETIKSVVNQSYKNIEIIVVDDCSNDQTNLLNIKKFFPNEDRIKYVKHEINKGLASSRNTALLHSKGTFFTYIDDDDLWEKNCLFDFVKYSKKYDKHYCFCGGIKYKKNKLLYKPTVMKLKTAIINGWTPPVSAQFYYKSSLVEVGGFNEKITSGIDHDIWIKLSIRGYNIVFIEECVSIPNNDLNTFQMTTDFIKRTTGISNSLELWKPIIIKNYSLNFFKHFENEYNKYLLKFFLLKSIKTYDIKLFLKIIFYKHNYRFFFIVLILMIEKFIKKNHYKHINPTFSKYDNVK